MLADAQPVMDSDVVSEALPHALAGGEPDLDALGDLLSDDVADAHADGDSEVLGVGDRLKVVDAHADTVSED